MPLKLKLWLGKIFGWDKGGLRAVLVLFAAFVVLLSAEWAWDEWVINDEPSSSVECNDACIDEIVDEILRTNPPPNPDRIIVDALND